MSSRSVSELRTAAEQAGFASDPLAAEVLDRLITLDRDLAAAERTAASARRNSAIAFAILTVACLAVTGAGWAYRNTQREIIATRNAEIQRLVELNKQQAHDAIAIADQLRNTIESSNHTTKELTAKLSAAAEHQTAASSAYQRRLEELVKSLSASAPNQSNKMP